MKYYELILTTFLKKNIHSLKVHEVIGASISNMMLQDRYLKEKHPSKDYKFYVFNSFYPIEKSKIYTQGRIYVFSIRSLDPKFINILKSLAPKVDNPYFKVLACEVKVIPQRHIAELYTVTPVVATLDGSKGQYKKYWTQDDSIVLLQDRMQANLEKKYMDFFKEDIEPQTLFIQRIEVLSKAPISYPYKNINVLGTKFKMVINEDSISQKLAFIALGAGLLEKNSSLGMGYCFANYL